MQQRLEVSEKRLRETRSEVENVQKRASLHLEAQMRCVQREGGRGVQREGGRGVQREGGRGVNWCVTVCVLVLLPPPPPSLLLPSSPSSLSLLPISCSSLSSLPFISLSPFFLPSPSLPLFPLLLLLTHSQLYEQESELQRLKEYEQEIFTLK